MNLYDPISVTGASIRTHALTKSLDRNVMVIVCIQSSRCQDKIIIQGKFISVKGRHLGLKKQPIWYLKGTFGDFTLDSYVHNP